ncbi:MAG: hypothetical protein Q9M36_12880 [Sulfurovum sp.]|nr:hypothetical protein [Sulfurovum sp.]
MLSLLLHLLILWLMTHQFESIILPPAPTEKTMNLNLQQIVTPPPAPKPKSIPKPKSKEIIKKVPIKKKVFSKKTSIENNITKLSKKSIEKIVKKKIIKKSKRRLSRKK